MTGQIAYIRTPNTDETLNKVGFLDEYAVLRPYFAALGRELVAVDWRDPAVDWAVFDFVIPKNAWDYFDHYQAFVAWLAQMEQQGTVCRNSVDLIRWNADKHYLLDMQRKGACVAPFRVITERAEVMGVRADVERHGRILLKPAISGGGKQTQVYTMTTWEACYADGLAILRESPLIVQPYLPEIEAGEWSYFFFGGEFSHVIVKLPKPGDFRAHSLFGATNVPATPSAMQIAEASAFLQTIPGHAQYARVDGVYVDGRLALIELELIEPYLYFECAPAQAPRAFAAALIAGS